MLLSNLLSIGRSFRNFNWTRLQLESHEWEDRFLLMANGQQVYPETCGNLQIMGDDRQITIQPVVIDIYEFFLRMMPDISTKNGPEKA